jgi:hypothetical protein
MIAKEWLEDIKERFAKYQSDYNLNGEDIEWLIQQAERYEDLLEQVKQIEKVSDYNADLRMKYEKALEFYAHKKNYDIKHLSEDEHEIPVFKDYGEKARQALEGDDD